MKKHLLLFIVLLSQVTLAQNNQLWQGYFSYNEVNDLTESPTRITASTQKALFSKSLATNELKTVNTIDGLSGQDISSIYYSQSYNRTIIGHANGLILIINESSGAIRIVPGIRDQNGISPNRKKINHFFEHEGKLYISCDFGLVQYNLITFEFGDTYLIGTSGEEVTVYQSTVLNNFIYAVTDIAGIRRADLSNANLNDFAQWTTLNNGFWRGIVTHNEQIVAMNSDGSLQRLNGNTFVTFANLPQTGIDIRSYQDNLIATSLNHVYSYDLNFSQTAHVFSFSILDMVVSFNCATIIGNTFYIGTKENGIITAPVANTSSFQVIKPDGPSRNNIFSIHVTPANTIWAVYGGYNLFYVPDVSTYGISKYSETGWLNIPFEETMDANSLVRIASKPSDPNNVFISSFHRGLLELQNDVAINRFDETTPNGPESLFYAPLPSYKSTRINGLAFDRSENLWFNNSRIANAIKVLKTNGQWQSYSIEGFVNTLEQDYSRMVIDKNGTKWFGSSANGTIGFNENVTPKFKLAAYSEDAGSPLNNNITSLAIDNRNQLWIGSMRGLRVLSSVDRFMSEGELETNPIIIIDDNLPQELFYEQFISDIVVDGANNKWVGTASSGVFLVSPNGQETLYHFTRENSPLPSNIINDIDINHSTGEVFFATDAGLVSFKGISTKGSGDLSNVYVYPNPVRPEFAGTVKISGLIDDANIKITDIEGNLVFETTSEGGTVEWDTKAFGRYRVASGVYMIFIASKDGTETKVKKVMIVR